LQIFLIVPLTSHKEALRFPYSFEIKKSEITNLDFDSVALVFQVRAIDKKRLFEKLGSLEDKDLMKLDETIKNLFKL
jgi:mRNA interferase MazF